MSTGQFDLTPAVSFANRAQDIMNAQPGLDHQTVAALAQQPGDPVQNAQTVAQAIAQTWDGYEQTWSDPVLQAQPSVQSGIVQFVHNTIGPPPIDAGTISQLQTALQKDGLGAGLATDGAWTPDWQQAYNQALQINKANQYAGQKAGSVKTSSALHGFLSHLTVTGALDAITGWVKSIPNDARQVAGDVGGAIAGLGHVVTHPSEILGNSQAEKETIATVNRSIQNALGGHVSQQQEVAAQSLGHQLSVLNSALTFAGIAGLGKKALTDIGENVARGTLAKGAAETVRQPGVIAKTLFNANQNGRLIGAKWVGNLPGLARVTPMVGKLAGSDGWYYTTRTMLAQPYRYAAVRAAGQAFSRTQLGGLGLYADALATSKLPGNSQSQNIIGDRTFDAIDHNIANYGPRVFGWSPLDLNNLALFLHGPVGLGTKGSASTAVGEHVQNYMDNFVNMLGEKGLNASFSLATGMSYQKMLDEAGGDSRFLAAFMASKAQPYAAEWYADRNLGKALTGADSAEPGQLAALKQQYRALPPEEKSKVMQQMIASDPSGAWLATRVKGDIARGLISPKAALRKSLSEFKTTYEKVQQLHELGDLQYVTSRRGLALLSEDTQARSFGGDLESGLPYQGPTRPNGLRTEGLAPPYTRREYMNTASGHATTIRNSIDSMLKVSQKRVEDAQVQFKALEEKPVESFEPKVGPNGQPMSAAKVRAAALQGAKTRLRAATSAHENALMAVGRTPQTAIDRAQAELDKAQQALQAAQDSGVQAQITAAEVRAEYAARNLAKVKASTRNMNFHDLMSNTVGAPETVKLRKQLEGLENRKAALANLVKGGVLPEELNQEIRNAINSKSRFDELYTRQFGPEQARPPGFGTGRYLQQLNPGLEKDIGVARLDSLLREDVLDPGGLADKFEEAIAASARDPAARAGVVTAMKQHLHENHNYDARKLDLIGTNPQKILDRVRAEAENLASGLFPTYDMPQATAARLQELHDLGYKLVVGDHLGDFYIGNLPDVGANDGRLTFLRKWAGKAGIDPTRVPDQTVGQATRQGIVSELAQAMQDPRVVMNPYQTPYTLLSMLREEGGVQKTLPWYAKGIFHATSKVGLNKTEIDYLFKNSNLESPEMARAELEAGMAAGLGPRDITRKAMYKALTTTHDVKTEGGGTWTWQAVDGKTANLLMRAVVNGYRQPGYIMGWQAIENWARAGYGFGDALANRYPGSSLLQNVANWPNRAVQVRNRLRFTVSAVFDIRRWVKQSAKMLAEGVEPTANPLQNLMSQASEKQAQALLQRIGGKMPELNDQMDVDRQLAGRSIWGLYSPQWHAAYFVNELRKAGKSEAEIKDAYNRVFKYGSGGGTSPLERSFNTIFFPFSFEKTLLRNFGGYLLDRPAQALVLDAAVDEWRKMDKNATVGKFVEDHFPILWEMNQLNNAFTHGISPGQFGGINAPIVGGAVGIAKDAAKTASAPTADQKSAVLLNLFLPQNWQKGFTKQNIARYLPVWNQFSKVWQAATEQIGIGESALYDVAAAATGSTQRRPTLTTVAQQQYGTREKVALSDKMQPVLDFNAKQADNASKIKWLPGADVPSKLWGQPISKTTIGEYVQAMYPAYDPAGGTVFAQAQQRAQAAYIAQVAAQDPAKGKAMQQFATMANSVIGKINRDEYSAADIAKVQNAFHEFARYAGSTDPQWLKLWESWFAYALGPVRSPNGKVAA